MLRGDTDTNVETLGIFLPEGPTLYERICARSGMAMRIW
jgi:hypothetical protein